MISRRNAFRSSAVVSLTLASVLSACGPEPLAAAPETLGSQTAALSEVVVNGNFSSGKTAPWWTSTNAQSLVENGAWRLNVTSTTPNVWDVIAGQSGIALAGGQSYTLSFTASATASGTLTATVQMESAPYTTTLNQKVTVDATARRYVFPFISSVSTAQGQVTFQLGGAAARTVRLDDISLTTASPVAMTHGFYVDPNSTAATWVKANPNDGRTATLKSAIADKPFARWFGNWSGNITQATSSYVAAAAAVNKLPVLVAYNIPGRDCGSHSGGGAGSPEAYRTWIDGFVAGIGTRPAIVVIEPDAVAQLDCISDEAARQTRLGLLRYATEQLRDRAPNTWAYLDGGNSNWIPANTMAQRLHSAGVNNIRGFALNVSNFYPTADSNTYGNAVGASLSSQYGYTRPFVVDTSRNGNGSNGEWCNPAGRKLGTPPQVGGGADLLLWVKVPGDSDGACGIAPNTVAGQFSPDIAWRLIQGT